MAALRIPYKPLPVKGNPGFPNLDVHWLPMLTVGVIYNHATSKRFEAVVDSGSPWCLFHAQIGESIGIKIDTGQVGGLGGVLAGASSPVYFHRVKLLLPIGMIETTAGFSHDLSVAAILGRQGFFDNCTVTFDPSQSEFGELEVERFHRA